MEVLRINPKRIEEEKVKFLINLLEEGRVIIFPTDTVYIPMADATNEKAVKKVFKIKGRTARNPVPIFVKDIKMAKKLAKIGKGQEDFLKLVWPGRITVVLRRKKAKIKLYGIAKDTVALRMPNFRPVNIVLGKLNRPLIGTSANISGKPASGDLEKVVSQFKGKRFQPDLIVDGGTLPGIPSTVIDLTVSPPRILRS